MLCNSITVLFIVQSLEFFYCNVLGGARVLVAEGVVSDGVKKGK